MWNKKKARCLIVHVFCTSLPLRSLHFILFPWIVSLFFTHHSNLSLSFADCTFHCMNSPSHSIYIHSIPFLIKYSQSIKRRSIRSLNTCSSFCKSHAYHLKFIPLTQKTLYSFVFSFSYGVACGMVEIHLLEIRGLRISNIVPSFWSFMCSIKFRAENGEGKGL